MRIGTIDVGGTARAAVIRDGFALDLTAAAGAVGQPAPPASVAALVAGGSAALEQAGTLLEAAAVLPRDRAPWHALATTTLLAPIPRPTKNVFCVGRNYKLHIEEGARVRGQEPTYPKVPEFFSKPPTAVIGHGAAVRLDARLTRLLDYEVELAIVIGAGGRDLSEASALDAVFGYTVLNDVTARDLQRAHGQWFKGKGLDTSCPIGPWITTADEFGDPGSKRIGLSVNGEIRQDSNTSDLLFSCAAIISSLSAGLTLEPGDIIATGTPSGVGYAMDPPRPLQDGDVIEAVVEGIGVLRNTVRQVG
jgi:2-keto-4-pentenoate hydratase/2-oxohepta-3-ene-1,7-dioic acid hydratase in catechol pathway